jgi:hypothetical protein
LQEIGPNRREPSELPLDTMSVRRLHSESSAVSMRLMRLMRLKLLPHDVLDARV